MTEHKHENHSLVERLDTLAHLFLVGGIFILPLAILPATWLPVTSVKMGVVALLAMGSLILWAAARLNAHTVSWPRTHVLHALKLVTLGYFVSALLSGHVIRSLVGFGFERDTVLAMLTFTGLFLAVVFTTRTLRQVMRLHIAAFAAFAVFAVVQVARILFGAEHLFPSFFSDNVTATVLGSWNDIAVLSGLVIIGVLTRFAFFNPTRYIRIGLGVVMALALFLLAIVNLTAVWAVLALVVGMLLLYIASDASYDRNTGSFKPVFPHKRMAAGLGVLAVSLVFIVGGTGVGNIVADTFDVAYVDVRPSWEGTVAVGAGAIRNNALTGVGPNAFRDAWVRYKPTAVNETTFWSTDFNFGVGLIPSAFVTGGILVGVLWLIFFAAFVHLGIRIFKTRIIRPGIMYAVLSSYLGAAFLWIITIVYVPQTVVLAYTFALTGITVAVATLAGVVTTRELKSGDGYTPGLSLMAGVIAVAVVSFGVLLVHAERTYASSMLARAVKAVNDGDLGRADHIAERASLFGEDIRSLQLMVNTSLSRMTETLNKEGDPSVLRDEFQGHLTQTISVAQRIVKLEPNNYRSHMTLGEIYARLIPLSIDGAYESARDAYTRAAELNPKNPSIYVARARLEISQGNTEGATNLLQSALTLKSNYTDAYYLLSQIAIRNGDVEEAIRSTEAAVLLRPTNAGLLFQLGILHYSAGSYEQVIPVLERAVAINSRYANALYFLGLAYDQTDQQADALAAFERVADLNPENEEVQRIVTALTEGNTAFSVIESAPNVLGSDGLPVPEAR